MQEAQPGKQSTFLIQFGQCRTFMCGYMIGFITFNFILRVVFGSMMRIALVVKVGMMNFNNGAGNTASFRIPGYMIAGFKICCHDLFQSVNKKQASG